MADYIAPDDAVIVQILKSEGAILMIRGNIPQMVFVFHSQNDIYGTALNPHDNTRSCAGSSGGEGGLIASKCIPLSVGTDIGGSIRGPAAFCGVLGFKPTSQRVSYQGVIIATKGFDCPQTFIHPSIGPLCNSVDDIKLYTETVFKPEHLALDSQVAPLPFNHDLYNETLSRNLRIGYFDEIPILGTSQSIKRAISISKEALESKGHTLVPFPLNADEVQEIYTIFLQNTSIAFIPYIMASLKQNYESTIAPYKLVFFAYTLSPLVRSVLRCLVQVLLGPRLAQLLADTKSYKPEEVNQIRIRSQAMEVRMKEKWENLGIDAVICPATYHCAFRL